MAKMAVINIICDMNSDHVVPEAEGVSYTITAPTGTVEIDLCLFCAEAMQHYVNAGRRVVQKREYKKRDKAVSPKDAGPYLPADMPPLAPTASGRPRIIPCGVGDCDYMGPDKRSVNAHKSVTHGIKGEHTK